MKEQFEALVQKINGEEGRSFALKTSIVEHAYRAQYITQDEACELYCWIGKTGDNDV